MQMIIFVWKAIMACNRDAFDSDDFLLLIYNRISIIDRK